MSGTSIVAKIFTSLRFNDERYSLYICVDILSIIITSTITTTTTTTTCCCGGVQDSSFKL